MSATSFQPVLSLELTHQQKEWVSRYLEETKVAVVETVTGLTPPQWTFKTGTDRWSIAQILEHLVLVEESIHRTVRTISEAPAAPPEWEPARVDHFIVTEIPKRPARRDGDQGLPKAQLPPEILPTQRWDGTEALARFVHKRQQNLRMVSGLSRRGRVIVHPVCGPWDGYQWLLAAAAHSARHAGQIREVTAHGDFPAPS